jgi:2-hydroxy-3-oxopropionate reductase
MGGNMARNLAKKHPLIVYDNNPVRLSSFEDPGIRPAGSLAEVGGNAEIVLLSLPHATAVRQVVAGPGGLAETMKPASVIIDMGTTEPGLIQELATFLAGKKIDLLDAPVSGGEKGAREATLSIMVGGPECVFERSRELFALMGSSVVRVGESGMGQVAKLVNNIIVAATFAVAAEGFALGVKSGLNPRTLFEAIRGGWAGSRVLEACAPAMLERNFQPGGTVNMLWKDLGYALSLGREQSVPLPITSLVSELFTAARAAGSGELAQPVIVTLWEKLLGIEVKG